MRKKAGRPAASKESESTEPQPCRRTTRSSKKRKAEEPIELSRFMDNSVSEHKKSTLGHFG